MFDINTTIILISLSLQHIFIPLARIYLVKTIFVLRTNCFHLERYQYMDPKGVVFADFIADHKTHKIRLHNAFISVSFNLKYGPISCVDLIYQQQPANAQ